MIQLKLLGRENASRLTIDCVVHACQEGPETWEDGITPQVWLQIPFVSPPSHAQRFFWILFASYIGQKTRVYKSVYPRLRPAKPMKSKPYVLPHIYPNKWSIYIYTFQVFVIHLCMILLYSVILLQWSLVPWNCPHTQFPFPDFPQKLSLRMCSRSTFTFEGNKTDLIPWKQEPLSKMEVITCCKCLNKKVALKVNFGRGKQSGKCADVSEGPRQLTQLSWVTATGQPQSPNIVPHSNPIFHELMSRAY